MASKELPAPDTEPRIGTSDICAVAKLSPITIQRRIKNGTFPKPIDRGKEQLFDRRAVYEALGIVQEDRNYVPQEAADPWLRGAHAIAERKIASVRCPKATW